MAATDNQTNTGEIETVKSGDGLEAVTVFEYGGEHGLMALVQCSVARALDLEGSMTAKSLNEVLNNYPDPVKRQEQIEKVSAAFDEALIKFVTDSMIAKRHRQVVIRASIHEGIDGYLPWQAKLEECARDLGVCTLKGLQIYVERFEPDIDAATQIPTQRDTEQSSDDQIELEPLELSA